MPIYEYQCDECGATVEAFQKMSDDPLETCEVCGGRLRKVLHPVAIHFKGSGFYTTDYGRGSGRRATARDAGAGEGGDGASGGDSASGDTGSKATTGTKGEGSKGKQKTA